MSLALYQARVRSNEVLGSSFEAVTLEGAVPRVTAESVDLKAQWQTIVEPEYCAKAVRNARYLNERVQTDTVSPFVWRWIGRRKGGVTSGTRDLATDHGELRRVDTGASHGKARQDRRFKRVGLDAC